MPLHDTTSKNLFRSPACFPLQILLLKILDDSFTLGEVKELIQGINLLTEDYNKTQIARSQKEKSLHSQETNEPPA